MSADHRVDRGDSPPVRSELFPASTYFLPSAKSQPQNLHSAVRKVLQHHKLTKHGDGVVEADIIAALRVTELLAACKAIDAFHTFFDSCIPPGMGKGAREALMQVAKAIR